MQASTLSSTAPLSGCSSSAWRIGVGRTINQARPAPISARQSSG